MPADTEPEGTIGAVHVSWTAVLIAKRFSRRLRQRIKDRKTRLPVCDADALDDIVRARLEMVTPENSETEVTAEQLLRTAAEFVHDATTGHETDLLRSRHSCAIWLSNQWYLMFVQAVATAWIATLFAEAAPGVPATSPGAVPVRWSVGGAELVFLVIAACDCIAHAVLECQARPLSRRIAKVRSVLCPSRMPTTNGTSLAFSIVPSASTYVSAGKAVRSSRSAHGGGWAGAGAGGTGIELKPPPGTAASSPAATSAMRRASLRHVASSATLGEEEGPAPARLRLRDWLFFQDKLWENGALAVVALALVEWVVYYAAGVHYFRLSRPLRPVLLIAKSPDLRRNLAVILRTFAAIGQITALFALLLLFYAVLGCQLFSPEQVSGYTLDNDNFGNFSAASLTLFVLQSTENFPTVMYPALADRPALALVFFLSGLYAFAWVITPLLLAVQYEHYQSVMNAAVRAQRAKGYVPMLAAYKCVAHRAVDEDTFVEFLMLARGLRRPAARALFHALDVEEEADSDRLVTAAEFLTLPQFLRLSPPGMRAAGCCGAAGSGPEAAEALRCGCYSARQRALMRETARTALRHPVVHWALTLAVWLSAVAACWWSWPKQQRYDACVRALGRGPCWGYTVMVEEYVALAALSVAVLEVVVRVAATGGLLRWLAASHWNSFDLVVVGWSWAASLAISMGAKQTLSPGATDLLEVTRAARILRVLSTVPELRAFVDVVAAGRTISIPRTAAMYAVLTVCVMLLWATVGQELFGDVPGLSMDGQIYTFETLGYAMLDMTQVLAVNNWNSIMYAVVPRARGGMATSLFFVSFFFVGSMVLTNCVSGIIIDYYSIAQADAQRERIQQSLFTGLGGEADEEDDDDGRGGRGPSGTAAARHAGILDPMGRVSVPPLDVALRVLCCCGGGSSSHHEEDLMMALHHGAMNTASSAMALPLWLLELLVCRHTAWSRVRSVLGVPVQPVAGLGRLSAKVMREYVAELREELREDIESQSPPRLWKMLRRRAAQTGAGTGGSDSDSDNDDGDDDDDDDDGDFVLSEAQALLLRQELGENVFGREPEG